MQHYSGMYAYTRRPFRFVFLQSQICRMVDYGFVWWIMALCGGFYSGVYVIERVRWTKGAREKAFKRQFVDYATEGLQLVVGFICANCSTQVRR